MEQWRSERLNSRVDVLHFPSHKINESENVWTTFLLVCAVFFIIHARLDWSIRRISTKPIELYRWIFFTCHLGYGSVRANSNRLWRKATSCFIGQKWIKNTEKEKLHLTLLSCVSSILDYFLLQRHVWREYRGTRQPLAVRLRSIRGTHIRPSQRKKLSLLLNDTNEGCRLVSQWDMSKEFDSLCVSGRRATLSHLTQSFLKYNINYRINSFISECWSEQKPIFSI